MANHDGFMARELPEKEMEMLYRLLGKNLPEGNNPRQRVCLWNLKFNRVE
jgi:hypothetical protein